MLSLVGIGGAGCRIVDAFYKKEPFSSILSKFSHTKEDITGVAIDTSSDSLTSLRNIPMENRVLIGKSRAKGHGTGASVELGRKIVNEELELAMNTIRKVNRDKPDFFFVIAGIGGGTGTGGTGIIADRLKKYYNTPVFGVIILPSLGEGTHYMKNAYSGLINLTKKFDGVIVQDNNVLTNRGEDITTSRKTITTSTVRFFNTAEPHEISQAVKGKVAGFGYMRVKSESMSAKDALQKLIRDKMYINLDNAKPEEFYLILRGNLNSFYGENFAREWIKNKYDAELNIKMKDASGSKNLDIAVMVTGIENIFNVEEETNIEKEKSIPPDLEDLLSDIQSL